MSADLLRNSLEKEFTWHGVTLAQVMRAAHAGDPSLDAWIDELSSSTDDITAAVGLDRDLARQAIGNTNYAAQVDNDWQRAAELGVTAVPTALYDKQALVGFQSYVNYRKLITMAEE